MQLIEGLNRIEGEEGEIGPFSTLPAGAGTSQPISSCPGNWDLPPLAALVLKPSDSAENSTSFPVSPAYRMCPTASVSLENST